MSWAMIVQSLITNGLAKKSKQVTKEEMYKHSRYLPILTFLAMAPGLCLWLSVILVTSASVAVFYPQYFMPVDYTLAFAAMALLLALVSYSLFLSMMSALLISEKKEDELNHTAGGEVDNDFSRILRPFKEQFLVEHEEIKDQFNQFQKNRMTTLDSPNRELH